MDEQAASERDAIPPQPRTVGRASVPGLTPVRPDAPPASTSATTYTAHRAAADSDAIAEEVADTAPRIPSPRISELDAEFGLPSVLRSGAEPLPRRRARAMQEFTDGPDPSSGGTPWSPFGAEEKPPPPPQDPNPYRVRATARVPGSLSPVDSERADRILPDGPLIDELFFNGPPDHRAAEAPPAVVNPPSAADYAAALMREWRSESDASATEPDMPPDDGAGDVLPVVNSGRARIVPSQPTPDDAYDAESDFDDYPDVADSASAPDLQPAGIDDVAPADGGGLLGLVGDSFEDLSFDRTPFDHADAVSEDQPSSDPAARVAPDLAALYGPATDGAAAPAYETDAYWGSAQPIAVPPLPRREPQPIETTPLDDRPLDRVPFDRPPVEAQSFDGPPVEAPSYGAVRPIDATPYGAAAHRSPVV